MLNIKNQKGIALLILALCILIAISLAGVGYYVYTSKNKNYQSNTNNSVSNNGCKKTGDIEVCLNLDNLNIEYGQPIKTKTTIRNNGAVDYEANFSCTDTTPAFIIDGKDNFELNMSICGQAITEVTLKPNESKTYDEPIPGDALKAGEYDIETDWNGNLSGKIRIKINPQSAEESARLNQACLKGEYSTNCSYIQIISVKGKDSPTTCDELYKLYDKYGMGKPNPKTAPIKNELCDLGIVKYIVPDNVTAEYVKKIEQDPSVESVNSEN